MAAAGARVTGIDMAEGPLAVARIHQHESGAEVDYRKTTAEQLAAEGVSRHQLGREKFVKAVWDWKDESGGLIQQHS